VGLGALDEARFKVGLARQAASGGGHPAVLNAANRGELAAFRPGTLHSAGSPAPWSGRSPPSGQPIRCNKSGVGPMGQGVRRNQRLEA
jgi:hypothetical protein